MALIAITPLGQQPTPVNIAADFAGTPGVDIPTDTWKVRGKEQLVLVNTHGMTNIRYKVVGTGLCSFGEPHDWPFPGNGTGGLDTYQLQAGGGIAIVGPLNPQQHGDASGIATIQFFTDAEAPLDPSTVAGSVTIAGFELWELA